jgi:hypothetical protein
MYTQNAINEAGVLNQVDREVSPIERATNRINDFVSGLHGLAEMMEGHADRLFGECPKTVGTRGDAARPVRSGLIGNLEDALDRLADAHARLAEACGRNNTLA